MSRCTDTRTEQVDGQPTERRCTREQGHDGMHQWLRPGHAVRWPNPDKMLTD